MKARVLFIMIALSCSLNVPANAWLSLSKGTAGSPGEYLTRWSGGARGAALGMAQTALSGEENLFYANPASLADMVWQEGSMSFAPMFGQGQFTTLGYAVPFGSRYVVGAGMVRMGSGDAEKTNQLGENMGTFSNQETALVMTCALKLSEKVRLGLNAKLLTQEMDTLSEKGYGADAGIMYAPDPRHRWAASLINIVEPQLGTDRVLMTPRLGTCHEMFIKRLYGSLDIVLNNASNASSSSNWFAGVEYQWPGWCFWRLGANEKQGSAGFGVATRQFDIDYALIWHPLDVVHMLTLNIRYGFEVTRAEEKVARDWDTMRREAEDEKAAIEKEQGRLRFERERLEKEKRLTVKIIRARQEFEDKKYDGAQKILAEILKEEPLDSEATQLLAEIKGRLDAANIIKRMGYAQKAYKQGEFAETLRHVNYILENQPDHVDARVLGYLAQAQTYLNEKKYKDAKGELIELLKMSPSNTEAMQLLKRVQTVIDIYGE